nr:helix-turn-helix domain-containing protein [Asticcacaulis taihuensis]
MTQLARSPKQLGSVLRRHRESNNMTQGELAGLAGVRQATISEVETGKEGAKLATLLNILAALDLEITISARTRYNQDFEDIF